eukprot:1851576-Lingulodinium_polyedra.AAC.1
MPYHRPPRTPGRSPTREGLRPWSADPGNPGPSTSRRHAYSRAVARGGAPRTSRAYVAAPQCHGDVAGIA